MKRPLPGPAAGVRDTGRGEGTPSTSKDPVLPRRATRGQQTQKRQRQTSMLQYCNTPGTTIKVETPQPTMVPTKPTWNSTARMQLQKFKLGDDTPRAAAITQVIEAADPPATASRGATGPAAPSPISGDEEFKITFSQSYKRSQGDDDDHDPPSCSPSPTCTPVGSPEAHQKSLGYFAEEDDDLVTLRDNLETRGSTTEMPRGGRASGRGCSRGGAAALLHKQHERGDTHPYHMCEHDAASRSGVGTTQRSRRSATPEVADLTGAPAIPAMTPDLSVCRASCSGGAGVGGSSHKGVFNMFKPVAEQRFVSIIRHGESEYNKAITESGCFKDPMIFDPALTAEGRRQASALRSRVADIMRKHGEPLWVVSPLTRCLQTFTELVAGLDEAQKPKPHNIVINSTISEFTVTAGDVGRPTSELTHAFPQFAEQLSVLPETWWYSKKGRANCALTKVMSSYEPKKHQQKRVAEFKSWLNKRPEKFVICVGHCSFWYQFLSEAKRLANCEMHTMYW